MSESCAALRRASTRSRRGAFRLPFWLAVALTFSLATISLATAQVSPTLSLGSYSYIVGETLELAATNLEPGGSYRVELTPPAVDGDAPAPPLVSVLRATPDGTLVYSSPLRSGGTYTLHVTGPRLDATFNVPVSGADSAIGQAPPSEPGANGTAPAAPEGEAGAEGQEAAPEDQPDEPDPAGEEDESPAGAPLTPGEQPGEQEGAAPGEEGGQEQPGAGAAPDLDQPDLDQPGTAPDPDRPTGPQAGATFRIDGTAIVAESQAGAALWRLEFPRDSGETAGLARMADRLAVGHGNHLLELDPGSGAVLARYRLPAQVVDTAFSGSAFDVMVRYQDGTERRVRVTRAGVEGNLPFDPDPALYGWLRNEANVVDPALRLERDPTNPWLYVAVAQRAPAGTSAADVDELLRDALAASATFYERAQLADAFLSLIGARQDLAASAMDGALQDFVARGYRAELLTDERLADAYGFPLGRLVSALGRGDLGRAGFWADWLYRTSPPTAPETQAALREYARYLQEAGQRDAASLWRTRANEGGGFQVGATLTNAALTVGRTGWYGVAALMLSILALHITLLAKYWRPQSLNMERQRAAGRSVSPATARLTFMRFASPMERVVMVLLFAAALALTALQGWATEVEDVPAAWGSGTLATPPALEAVSALDLSRPDALFVRGYAAQTADNRDAAAEAYRRLADDPAALNNLAVLTGDPALFARALERDPDHEVVLANLGRADNPSPLLAAYAEGEPVLVAPSPARMQGALAGTYLGAWAGAFTNPWAALTGVEGVAMPVWVWTALVALFLLWAALTIIVLFAPRPRLARNAPRTLLYHVLALLLPGTGLTDEFWGVLLMVPWAIFGVDFLLHYLPAGPDPTMALRTDAIALIVIYALNLVAFLVELASYRRRMATLKRNDPQTAREYGMRVSTPDFA